MAENPGMTLSDIVRGLQYAVDSANHIAEQQYKHTVAQFFTGSQGKYQARTFEMNGLQVPLISLVNINTMLMKRIKIELDIKVDATEIRQLKENESTNRASFAVRLSGKETNDTIGVEIEFERADVPEGFARIIEDLINKIGAIK